MNPLIETVAASLFQRVVRIKYRRYPFTAVLMYHGVVPDDFPVAAWTLVRRSDFEKQVALLRTCFDIVHPHHATSLENPAPNRPKAVLTFDDGYKNLYQTLYPVAVKERVPITVFVATGLIGTERLFWFDRVILGMQPTANQTKFGQYNNAVQSLLSSGDETHWDLLQDVLSTMKELKRATMEALADRCFANCKQPESVIDALKVLDAATIKAMAAEGLVQFGSHTHHHELLDRIPLPQAEQTITQSLAALRELTGRPCRSFAYPNGNYTPAVLELLKPHGIRLAFTTVNDVWRHHTDPLAIPRVPVGAFDTPLKFMLNICGGINAYQKFHRRKSGNANH